jgi:hypothetical protein
MELKAAIQSRCQLECPLLDRASKDKTELLSEPNELPDELHRSVESAAMSGLCRYSRRSPRRVISAIGRPMRNMCTRMPVIVMYNGPPPPVRPIAESGITT